jgi:parallel beta-helix repeat protein
LIEVIDSSLELSDSVIEEATSGLKFMVGGLSKIRNTSFSNLSEGAVFVITGARVEIAACEFSMCGNFAVSTGQRGAVFVRACRFNSCDLGVKVMADGSKVTENTFTDCKTAIVAVKSSPKLVIFKNRITGGENGIVCTQFSSPQVVANEIEGAQTGIYCFQGSSPLLIYNRVKGGKTGVSCVRMCNPTVEKNQLLDNEVGVYLQTSSYAVILNNNFEGNGVNLELGDMMSADWENRVRQKPARAGQARNRELVKLGRARPVKIGTEIDAVGEVKAGKNWWGKEATAEMEQKGPDANIAGFKDSFDASEASYEGYEGGYKIDRIIYADWLKEPREDAGPEGLPETKEPAAEEKK